MINACIVLHLDLGQRQRQ